MYELVLLMRLEQFHGISLSMNLHLQVSFYNMMTEDAISVAISRMKPSICVLDPVPVKLFGVSVQSLSQETTIITKHFLSLELHDENCA